MEVLVIVWLTRALCLICGLTIPVFPYASKFRRRVTGPRVALPWRALSLSALGTPGFNVMYSFFSCTQYPAHIIYFDPRENYSKFPQHPAWAHQKGSGRHSRHWGTSVRDPIEHICFDIYVVFSMLCYLRALLTLGFTLLFPA